MQHAFGSRTTALALPFSQQDLARYGDQAIQFGLRLVAALLVVLVGIWVARRLANVAERAFGRARFDVTLSSFLRNLLYGVLIALLIVTALQVAGVPSAPLVAALGAGGLAIGLSLQGSLSNLAWGVLLALFRPFRVGDFVEVGGMMGTVDAINLMYTQLLMPDGREAALPNAVLAWGTPYDSPLWEGRSEGLGYVCRDYACLAPADSVSTLLAQLDA